MNKANVGLIFSGYYPLQPGNNIKLSALGIILGYRMIERIREAEGGAYTPYAGATYTK